MARGRKKMPENYEERIALMDEKINKLSQQLKLAKDQKKAMEKEHQERADLEKWEQIRSSGKSPDEILKMLGIKS